MKMKTAVKYKSKSVCFSIGRDQNEIFRRLQSEAKTVGVRLTFKKIILGKIKEK